MDQQVRAENNTDQPFKTSSKSEQKNKKSREPMGTKWYATINNWTEEQLDQMDQIFSTEPKILRGVIGQEVGECGTPHLQCYMEFERRIRPPRIWNLRCTRHGNSLGRQIREAVQGKNAYNRWHKLLFQRRDVQMLQMQQAKAFGDLDVRYAPSIPERDCGPLQRL